MSALNFIVVSKPGCPWCSLVKHDLTKLGHYVVEDCLETAEARAAYNTKHGTTTFPQVWQWTPGPDFDYETHIGGYEATMAHIGVAV